MEANRPKISVSLVTYNSVADLPKFFESLDKQTYNNFEVIVIDNASNDGTIDYLNKFHPAVKIIKNSENGGYGKGHNQGIKAAQAPYILIANPDIRLSENFLLEAISQIEYDEKIAAVGGKLYKLQTDLKSGQISDMLDSTGFLCFKNRQVVDRGEGENDESQYDSMTDVFGVSGALVLFNKKALDDVRLLNGQYFDERYFMYQEDVDLAWRLRLRGWSSRYLPKAIAWHRRTGQSAIGTGVIKNILHRRKKSALVNQLSYRNHLSTLIKNETAVNLIKRAPWILGYELGKIMYLMIFEPRTILKSAKLWAQMPELLRQRKAILHRRNVSHGQMDRWFQ